MWSANSSAWAYLVTPLITSHARSEEHTSELQSQSNLVCRLLLDKQTNLTPRRRAPALHTHQSAACHAPHAQPRHLHHHQLRETLPREPAYGVPHHTPVSASSPQP